MIVTFHRLRNKSPQQQCIFLKTGFLTLKKREDPLEVVHMAREDSLDLEKFDHQHGRAMKSTKEVQVNF